MFKYLLCTIPACRSFLVSDVGWLFLLRTSISAAPQMENFKHCNINRYVSGPGCSTKVICTRDRDLTWNLGTWHTPTLVG